jgi:hypothetical protein
VKGVLKSQEGFYSRLHAVLIRSVPLELSSSDKLSLEKDISVLQQRCSHEGLAFLTKSLPKLGRALDQGLVSGRFTTVDGFKSASRRSTPAFLQAYFNLVFDEDGFLLDTAPPDVVKHLRQVLWFAYKLEIPFSDIDASRVIENFVQTDRELKFFDDPLASDILSLAKIITRKVFHDFDHKDILPRHGPGAVATGEKLEHKWRFSRLYDSIHQVYPYYDYYVVGRARELQDRLDWYKALERLKEGTSKVVLVPKDSRGPRLISCEPLEIQWIQQGLGRKMARHLEYVSTYTRFRVNFTHQDINRRLAQTSSASQQYSTLDLKDASDRVSLELVRSVFKDTPGLLRALEAVRSTATRLPNGELMPFRKYAPMGSALCFPVEAYVFWAVIVSAVVIALKLPLEQVGRRIYVYGDDIVIPTKWSALSIQALEVVGLKVNVDKSCITGNFRESCGMDAFKGIDVTPSRLHTLWTNRSSDGSAYAAYVSLSNSLEQKGYTLASDFLWAALDGLYGNVPYGTFRASYPCRIVNSVLHADTLNRVSHQVRFNRDYQRSEYYLPSLSSRRRKFLLDGWPRLLRNMVAPSLIDPSVIVLPLSMKIKRGWTAVA